MTRCYILLILYLSITRHMDPPQVLLNATHVQQLGVSNKCVHFEDSQYRSITLMIVLADLRANGNERIC